MEDNRIAPPEVQKAAEAIVRYFGHAAFCNYINGLLQRLREEDHIDGLCNSLWEGDHIWLCIRALRDWLGMPTYEREAQITRHAEDEWQATVEAERQCVEDLMKVRCSHGGTPQTTPTFAHAAARIRLF